MRRATRCGVILYYRTSTVLEVKFASEDCKKDNGSKLKMR